MRHDSPPSAINRTTSGSSPKALARQIYYVWQRLLNKPPARKTVAGLITEYFFSLAVSIGAPVIFKSALMVAKIEKRIEIQKSPVGIETKREAMYLAEKLLGFAAPVLLI